MHCIMLPVVAVVVVQSSNPAHPIDGSQLQRLPVGRVIVTVVELWCHWSQVPIFSWKEFAMRFEIAEYFLI